MKTTITTLILIIFSSINLNAQSSIVGIWDTGESQTQVEIYEEGSFLKGKIHSSDNKKAQIGQILLKNLKEKNGLWKGEIYAPKRKSWYKVEINPNGNLLDLEISVGFFSQSRQWKGVIKEKE